jgi:acyl transferase domain-containing protein/NAD(P)-dependent dehydrogenase (short-subunit alcohol dehydrogenase family)/acyl carrier protein
MGGDSGPMSEPQKERMSEPSQQQRINEPLAIVGIGCLFPGGGRDAAWYWATIKNGVDCIREVPPERWPVDEYYDADPKASDRTYARRGAFLEAVEFDPLAFGIAPRDLEATDSTQLLALLAAQQALADAGIEVVDGRRESGKSDPGCQVPRERVAVILGVTGPQELVIPLGSRLGYPQWRRGMRAAGIPEAQIEEAVQRIGEQFVSWQENSFPGLLGNVVAGRIANRLNLGGTNCVVDAACASALAAVEMAALELETGRADLVITGGCDTFSDIFMYMCFSKTPALSRTGDARPFDAEGDGTILGEGLGLVVLRRLSEAVAAGNRIYAVLRGIGSSSDGRGPAIYAPSAEGQQRCLRVAYERAGISPATVELVEAHGTGTKVGDATEAQALIAVYGAADQQRRRPWCALGSVKSQIGHTKAAAGAASLIKAVLALYHKVLPPTLKVRQPVEPLRALDCPFYLNTLLRPWIPHGEHPRRAAVSAFGFGGSNFHAVLEEYTPDKTAPDWTGQVEILPLTGECPEDLHKALEQLPDQIDELFALAEQARRQWNPSASWRLLLVVTRQGPKTPKPWFHQIQQRLDEAVQQRQRIVTPGAYLGYGPAPGGLAVVFPGQGSQYVGMLRELSCLFPEMLESLAQANTACGEEDGWHLTDRIYPPPAFEEASRERQAAELRATHWAQPALGAVSWGAWRVLHERFGLSASAWAGHSYGELVALAAAGCYPAETLWRLSRERGRLLAEAGQCTPGSMLAVRTSSDQLKQWLTQQQWQLVVANRNGPEQQVLSGPVTEIERAATFLQQRGVGCVRLSVSGAFHSPWVQSAVEPFHRLLNACPIQVPQGRVYANATAAPYPAEPSAIRHLLAEQLVRPVAFQDQVERMLQDGLRCFVEVGPGTVLTRLITAIARHAGLAETVALPLDASTGQRSSVEDLAHLLAQLAALSYPVRLDAWERESRCRPPQRQTRSGRFTVSISGANYVAPRPSSTSPTPQPKPASPTPASPSPRDRSSSEARPAAPPASIATSSNASPSPTPQTPAPVPRMTTVPPPLTAPTIPGDHNILKQSSHSATIPSRTAMKDHTPSSARSDTYQDEKAIPANRVTSPRVNSDAGADRCGDAGFAPVLTTGSTAGRGPGSEGATDRGLAGAWSPDQWQQLLQLTWQSLNLVQRIQEHTAALHKQFLDAQETAQRTLLTLLEQQRQLWGGSTPPSVPGTPPPIAGIPPTSNGATAAIPFESHSIPAAAGVASPSPLPGVTGLPSSSPSAVTKTSPSLTSSTSSPGLPSVDHCQSVSSVPMAKADQQGTAFPSVPVPTPAPVSAAVPAPVSTPLPASTPAPVSAPTSSPPPVPAPASVSQGVSESGAIAEVVLQVVSEKTGYPVESLGWDLLLDADLGIDSIKRVEIFSALQERLPAAPTVKAEHVGQLQTLRDVIRFLTAGKEAPLASAGSSGESSPSGWGTPTTTAVSSVAPSTTPSVSATVSSPPSSPSANGIGMSSARESGAIAEVVLQVVSEKTGYPVESLGWDLVLDADLGIDSIKRVEIFSALQERLPGAPAVKAEHVGQLQTLRDVIDFLTTQPNSAVPSPENGPTAANGRSAQGENPDFFPSAFPLPPPITADHDPPLSHSAQAHDTPGNTGDGNTCTALRSQAVHSAPLVDHSAIRRTAVNEPQRKQGMMSQESVLTSNDWSALVSRQVLRTIPWVGTSRPSVPVLEAGEVWIIADDDDALAVEVGKALTARGLSVCQQRWEAVPTGTGRGSCAGLILVAPLQERPIHPWVLRWLQRAAETFPRSENRRAFLVGLTRLDGQFGLGPLRPDTPVEQSGLAGWIKTACWEWPQVACKVIDVAPEWSEAPEMAQEVAAEVLLEGPIEIGLSEPWQRWTPALVEEPLLEITRCCPLQADDVVLITGGGRGVTAELAQALSEAGCGTLVLVGRTPLPEGEAPPWWPESEEETVLKRAVAEHLGVGASPRQIQEQYQLLRAQQELRRTLQRLSARGAQVIYRSLDVADKSAVQRLVSEVRQCCGPITRLIHGAGVLADRRIEDLTLEQFERVYRTKVTGLQHFLEALDREPLRTLAVFSSTTARVGRAGQGAYACANEVLNKLMQREARRRPQTRVIAFNWGPWDGGMVTPALKRMFAAEGVGLIPREAGGWYAAWEMQNGDNATEIVISARNSPSEAKDSAWPVVMTDSISRATEPAVNSQISGARNGEVAALESNGVTGYPGAPRGAEMTLAFERRLDVRSHPVLADHVLEGRAVVPVALHLEWLAHAAVHRHPGLQFCGCDQLRIYHGLKLDAANGSTLQVWCGPARRQDGYYWQTVEVRSRTGEGREWLHARACVLVAEQWPAPPPTEPLPSSGQPWPWSMEHTYERLLFHGPRWRGLQQIRKLEDDLWLATVRPAPAPAQWLEAPLRSAWLADPLVLDGALQLLIVAAYQRYQLLCLPVALGRYRQYRRHFPITESIVLLRLRCRERDLLQADIEFRDDHGLIAQIQDCEAVLQEQLVRAFRNNRLKS